METIRLQNWNLDKIYFGSKLSEAAINQGKLSPRLKCDNQRCLIENKSAILTFEIGEFL